ncbi:MAG: M24 family metallopeptidase, partial [Candidatus Bathyarchaeia archaeon]
VVWWMRQKILDLGLRTWFQPSVSIRAPGQQDSRSEGARKLILLGDLLHCDFGIQYLGLATDTQQNAYVLKLGEEDAPEGLKAALGTANRLQDIVVGEFVAGRTGNQILAASLEKSRAEGIKGAVYNHPIGYHGHGAGPTIGLWDKQDGVPGRGDYELFDDTCHAIELNIRQEVQEWGGQEVRMALEEDVVFTGGKVHWLAGRQTKLHLIG